MRHGSLFSGIGGFDLAAEWMGWENIFHCEWNPFGQRVLKHYWPNAKSYEDITQTDFTIHRGTIDILTGGFPCQPYSAAGKRLGKEDERHLWPEMLRAIREIAPSYIVGENVLGLVNWNGGLVFDEVQADLESEGYEVAAVVIPAAAVNAPHGRDRVWFVARNTKSNKSTEVGGICERENNQSIGVREINRNATDTDKLSNNNKSNIGSNAKIVEQRRQEREGLLSRKPNGRNCENNGVATNASSRRISGHRGESKGQSLQATELNENDCKFYRPMDWREFPTQSPICSRNDGLSRELDGITFSKWRNESIRAYGNAIVPNVAFEIFKVIQIIANT